MARPPEGLKTAMAGIEELQEAYRTDLLVPGSSDGPNQVLERAGRLADYLELGHLMCRDALERDESCGCHFREEHQTEDGEVLRNDEDFQNVSVWEWKGEDQPETLHKEHLNLEALPPTTRSYK